MRRARERARLAAAGGRAGTSTATGPGRWRRWPPAPPSGRRPSSCPPAPGMRLLDAGCRPRHHHPGPGGGRGPRRGGGPGAQPAMVAQARALAAERGVVNARFEAGDVQALPFPDASFDAPSRAPCWSTCPTRPVQERRPGRWARRRGVPRTQRPAAACWRLIGLSPCDHATTVLSSAASGWKARGEACPQTEEQPSPAPPLRERGAPALRGAAAGRHVGDLPRCAGALRRVAWVRTVPPGSGSPRLPAC